MAHDPTDLQIDNPIPEKWTRDERHLPGAEPVNLLEDVEPIKQAGTERDGFGRLTCTECKAVLKESEEPHVMFARVVRPNNYYGGKRAGGVVYVEITQISGPVLEVTMSLDEHRAREVARAKPAEKAKPRLVQMVEQTLPAFVKKTQEEIRAGKERIEREASRAYEHARDFFKSPTSVDQDPPGRPAEPLGPTSEQRLEALEAKQGDINQKLDLVLELLAKKQG